MNLILLKHPMPKTNPHEFSLQHLTLFTLFTAIAISVLFISLWVATTKPMRLKIMGKTCPEYPPAPSGCQFGITTGTDKNGCITITCFHPAKRSQP